MKKIHYLLAAAAMVLVSACNPLDKTYKQIGDLPAPTASAVTASITLTAADYALAPKGSYAVKGLSFKSIDSAKLQIPTILAAKYPTYGNGSSILVTYANAPTTIKLADSVYSNVAYTVVNPTDYVAASSVTGTTFKDYNDAQVLLFLQYKYPNPVANQLSVLTYQYFQSGVTPSSGVTTTDSFIYLNGVWTKIYTVSAAQYASVGHSTYNQFVVGDAPATIVGYINIFLKNDPKIAPTAKYGDVQYVSYNYYTSSTKVTSQRVQAVTFDGTNWVTTALPTTPLSFVKTNGVWVADNTVTLKLATADYKFIAAIPGVASDAAMANLNSFGNFNIQGGTTSWTDAQINNGIIALLKSKYPAAAVNQKFVVTYAAYNGSNITVTKTFVYDGTTFKVQ
ncbi:hypothetical protein ACFS5N_04170 [Mucilaginibacter ximonensis]|uniref:DUF5017 domain-containing protein n=1 Tax=Mucilaginibacter ximonensis TaxID=538021 RepID=A0ABW5Y8Q4_9SPHI